uniref:Uncharacterized protein n=1 Tax=Heterorhabditis bacteriophora TaxID=37862 RepID=A0A1I7WB88_HETBA
MKYESISTYKILGIHWDTYNDTFNFTLPTFSANNVIKRPILQFILFLQKLWKAFLLLDEPLHKNLFDEWISLRFRLMTQLLFRD